MGMGASCNRWDCAALTEERQRQYQPFLLYDCTGQPPRKQADIASSQERCMDDAERYLDSAELVPLCEAEVQPVCHRFAIHKIAGAYGGGNAGSSDWRHRYILGRELGTGQTATVFEAFTAGAVTEEEDSGSSSGCVHGFCQTASTAQPRSIGRRVAVKRFFKSGTTMFRLELNALTAVGTHPHVLRLLESYEGGKGEDVLVLEHCDGGDVYELYAANNGCSMLEAFVLQLIRQMLLAVEHLVERGIEHRDVKPENLLLYGSSMDTMTVPQLKLADFGWAAVVEPDKGRPKVPPEGVGSLWYAPPELNPPVRGVDLRTCWSQGCSDMWSVGVITYLLLVGHSPFNPALRMTDPQAREDEVIRLAAFGQINSSTRPWACLSDEARSFICALIQPEPARRLSPREAWHHPFLARWQNNYMDGGKGRLPPSPKEPEPARRERWRNLDGFQRLGWLAFARAVAEPEVLELSMIRRFVSQQTMGSTLYLEQLAVELALAAKPSWFQPQAAFADTFLLGFRYLDCDADGVLCAADLMRHVVGEDIKAVVDGWVSRWSGGSCRAVPVHSTPGLNLPDFRRALGASCEGPLMPNAEFVMPEKQGEATHFAEVLGGTGKSKEDAMLERRMHEIEEVCGRYLDEELNIIAYQF